MFGKKIRHVLELSGHIMERIGISHGIAFRIGSHRDRAPTDIQTDERITVQSLSTCQYSTLCLDHLRNYVVQGFFARVGLCFR